MRFKEVRVVSDEGQLGVMDVRDALSKAQDVGLDLVLVAENADPPVCRIVDFGKYKYEQSKLKRDQKKKVQEVKGIKISPNIAEHDIQVAFRKAEKFLGEGNKVRLVCRFKKRELDYPDRGKQKLMRLAEDLAEFGKAEREPVLNGREMVMVMSPKAGGGKSKNAKAEDKEDSS